jgi:hypothetical protein
LKFARLQLVEPVRSVSLAVAIVAVATGWRGSYCGERCGRKDDAERQHSDVKRVERLFRLSSHADKHEEIPFAPLLYI